MISIEKQVAYWRKGAEEELYTARRLLTKRSTRQCLFFAHLALEKALKAHVCQHTQDIAPRMHNLPKLAQLGNVALSAEQDQILIDIDEFNLEGRYPEQWPTPPGIAQARRDLRRAEEIVQWLLSLLSE
jgi:HEPN domain-containing protein